MSRFASAWALRAAIVGVLSLGLGESIAQPVDGGQLRWVQQFMNAAFPGEPLRDAIVTVSLSGPYSGRDWANTNRLAVIVPSKQAIPGVRISDPISGHRLYATFQFIEGYLHHAFFNGSHVRSVETDAFTKLAQSHPEWTEPDLQRAFTGVSARYGPGERAQFLADVALQRFEPVLGRIVRSEAFFVWRVPSPQPGLPEQILRPGWEVVLETVDFKARHVCYAMSFEPLSGQLVGVSGTICEKK